MKKQTNAQSLEIANLAASYLIEGAADSFQLAKQKAARALGASNSKSLPSNIDLQRALAENLSLFDGEQWRERIKAMRTEALRAIKFFSSFEGHLTGAVLYGTATAFSVITLHLHSDDVEQVIWRLRDAKIAFRLTDILLKRDAKSGSRSGQDFPCIELTMDDFDFEIVILPLSFRFNPPCSPLDGKPYQRADAQKIKDLIDTDTILFGRYLSDFAEPQS